MNAPIIDDHVAQAQARFLQQYQGRPNLAAFLQAFTQHVQQIENALYGIPASFQLATAQGAQLDVVGAQVGAERNGLSDAQYRALIQGAIAQNNGNATVESLLSIIRGLFQTTSVFLKRPDTARRGAQVGSATLSIAVGDPTVPSNVFPQIQAAIASALGAGVAMAYLGQFQASAHCFACAGDQPWVGGFGSINSNGAGAGLGSVLINNPTN